MSQDISQNVPEIEGVAHQQPMQPSAVNLDNLPDPFAQTTATAFFGGANRRVLLDEVIHLCQFGNNLVAALGDSGVGKSTFLSQARYELAETAFCCFIQSSPTMTAKDLFTQIISQLELSVQPASSAGQMIAILRRSMSEGNLHRIVIIVDDAHHLNDEILSALVSLLQGQQGQHLHILVGGDKTLAQRFDQFDMVDILVYDITLYPLSEAELKEYVAFKLASVGYPNANNLSDTEIKSLWKESQGYPAKINAAAQNLLFEKDLAITPDSDWGNNKGDDVRVAGLPILHISLLVVLLAGLIMALFYMGGDDSDETERSVTEITLLPKEGTNTLVPSISNGDSNQAPVKSGSISGATIENIPQANLDADPKVGSTRESTSTAGEVAQVPAEKTAEQVPTLSSLPIDSAPKPKPTAVKTIVEQDRVITNISSSKEKITSTKPVIKKAPKEVAKRPALADSIQDQSQKVLSWPNDRYTLQVMAASQKSGLLQFIAKQPNKSDLRLVTLSRNNKPWYVVVVGVYDSGSVARQSIQSLPQSQVNASPWPRKISDLKSQINASGGN